MKIGAAIIFVLVIYIIWLTIQYHNPPTYCYLTGCHFTLGGWK